MREFRRLLLVHEGRDWGRAVQPLLDGDEDLFPYDYVHHEGTQLVMNVPEGWEYDEVVSEDGTLLWSRDDHFYERESAMEMVNLTFYCSLLKAHLIHR